MQKVSQLEWTSDEDDDDVCVCVCVCTIVYARAVVGRW